MLAIICVNARDPLYHTFLVISVIQFLFFGVGEGWGMDPPISSEEVLRPLSRMALKLGWSEMLDSWPSCQKSQISSGGGLHLEL